MIPRKAGFVIACIGFVTFCGLSMAKEFTKPIVSVAALQGAAEGRYTVIATVSGGSRDDQYYADMILSDGSGSVVAMRGYSLGSDESIDPDRKQPKHREILMESRKYRDSVGDQFVAYVEVVKEDQFYRATKVTPKQVKGSWGQRTIQTADGFKSLTKEQIKKRRTDDWMEEAFMWLW